SSVLRIDRDKHLHNVIFGHTVENNRRHGEIVIADVVDVGVKRKKTMLPVNSAEDSFTLWNLEATHSRTRLDRLACQLLVAGDDHGARNGRQIVSLTALFVILDEFVDLSPDDLALIGFLARRDPAFEQIPVHFRRHLLLPTANRRLPRFAVTK